MAAPQNCVIISSRVFDFKSVHRMNCIQNISIKFNGTDITLPPPAKTVGNKMFLDITPRKALQKIAPAENQQSVMNKGRGNHCLTGMFKELR